MARKTKNNSITSPELLAQVNPENRTLKQDFLDYLQSLDRSPGTISGYSNDLDILNVWILQNAENKKFANLTKREIVRFQNWLVNENGNSPARVRRIKAAMSSLSNFIEAILQDEEEEYKDFRSIVRKIENPALVPVREKTVWKDEELEDLLAKLLERKDYQKACCVALAMYGGRRKAELCRFRVSDFTEDHLVLDGALYKSSPIKTKGAKMLECFTLAKKFQPYLDLWMEERRLLGIDSEWLFVGADNKSQIQITTLNSWADSFTKMTGRDFYFHSLRHYYCTALVKAGIPDSVIIDIIGWSSADMLRLNR